MNIEELGSIREKTRRNMFQRSDTSKKIVVVGINTGALEEAGKVVEAFINEISMRNIEDTVVMQSGELGNEDNQPVVKVEIEGRNAVYYGNIDEEKAKRIVSDHIAGGSVIEDYKIRITK